MVQRNGKSSYSRTFDASTSKNMSSSSMLNALCEPILEDGKAG
jgi:hypothetical protein